MKLKDIRIRDPFILPLQDKGRYYLYGTTELPGSVPSAGFNVYYSDDLKNWDGPVSIFAPHSGFWSDRDYWAPEVYLYNGKFYMFASFKAEGKCRATHVLVTDNPLGQFVPCGENPVTPLHWECLDGTLYIDDDGEPWMIFCHEWLQVGDGEICAVRLSRELDTTIGNPILLFTASQAAWSEKLPDKADNCYITDGPWLHKSESGELLMLWSSFSTDKNYSLGIARSQSGSITGPWTHDTKPLYSGDGGHAMIFKTFNGELMLSLHAPNCFPDEHAILLHITDTDGKLVIKKE